MAGSLNMKLDELIEKLAAEEYGIDAFMVWKKGNVVAKGYRRPFRAGDMHQLFSVTKSFTSVAVGILMDEGRLSLDDRIVTFFPEYLPFGASENMSLVTIRNLLTMTAGFDEAPDDLKRHIYGEYVNDFPYSYRKRYKSEKISWVRDFLHTYVDNRPGDRFVYSDACSLMLSAVVQKITGMTTKEFLDEKVFSRLGIHDVHWQVSPDGISTGGWGIKLDLDSLLRFGRMILHKGEYNGERIISPSYIEDMGSAHIPTGASRNSVERNFGYQTWILGEQGIFGGIGAFGQMYIVYPEEDMVYVQFGSSARYMKTLGLLVNELPEVIEGLEDTGCRTYDLDPYGGTGSVPDGEALRAVNGKGYIFSQNLYGIEKLGFQVSDDRLDISLTVDGRTSCVRCGFADFCYSDLDVKEDESTDIHNALLFRKVASRTCMTGGKIGILLDFYETGYKVNMGLEPLKHGIRIEMKRNLGFIPDANSCVMIGVLDE